MKKFYLFPIYLLLLSACGNPLGSPAAQNVDPNFHPGVPDSSSIPDNTPPAPSVALPFGGIGGMKLSSGAIAATGPTIALSATVTPTNLKTTGTQIGATLSLGKFRMR